MATNHTKRKGAGKHGRGGRAHAVTSRLTDADTPIYKLAQQFQEQVFLPDPSTLYVAMGALAGNMLTGEPVWLMLVGASGGGKTMYLNSMLGVPRVQQVSSIKGEAALLSGVNREDRAEDATGGLLKELGDNGALIFTDFTSILSKSKDAVNEMLGVLRHLYDQDWSRSIGGEGGRRLTHTGKVAVIAAVTNAIDRQAEVNSEMGQRCLYYRLPQTSGYQESMSAVNVVDNDYMKQQLRWAVHEMFNSLGLSMEHQQLRRKMNVREQHRIVEVAQLGARLRSGVPRDWRDRSVIDVPAEEVATRMSKQLTQLYLGMEILGVEEDDRWAAVEKIALDSMPLIRKLTLDVVRKGGSQAGGGVSTAGVAREIKVSESAARRTLEDLELLGTIKRIGGSRIAEDSSGKSTASMGGTWKLTPWMTERLGEGAGFGGKQAETEIEPKVEEDD